jgi:hypothetical protein
MSQNLCVKFFDVSKFFRGPYRINQVQFTKNKSESFGYSDTFDLETFFKPLKSGRKDDFQST